MMNIRIGPAGLGPVKDAIKTLERYHELGFRACEIAFTYSVYIKKEEDARAIGKRARELDIALSIHAPYFVNLNSHDAKKREASRNRILECCRVASWLGASHVVFHPGYYGDHKENAVDVVAGEIKTMAEVLKKNKWHVTLAPETMGKVNVFGSLDEIANVMKESECGCCIDFAHILARYKHVDYALVRKLFPQKHWHVHFSGIIYGEKGEKSHKTTEKGEWKALFGGLPKDKDITIINESPSMIDDCIEGLKLVNL